MRVVLDTNVLISGLFWKGAPYSCLVAAEAGLFELFISDPILKELERVLQIKFRLTRSEISEALTKINRIAKPIKISQQINIILDDPDDNKFLEAAMASGAEFIVSGDKHLLKLQEYQGIKILNARNFLYRVLKENK